MIKLPTMVALSVARSFAVAAGHRRRSAHWFFLASTTTPRGRSRDDSDAGRAASDEGPVARAVLGSLVV